MKMKYLSLVFFSLVFTTCSSAPKVTRTDASAVIDLSGKWNETDSRLVSEEMIPDCLSRPWLQEYVSRTNKKPVVLVGTIKNKSYEHIAIETFINDLQRELVNSGRVSFVAESDIRAAMRDEKYDQTRFASEETMKEMGKEIGADFMLFGSINAILDQIEGKRVMFYQIDLELINIETNEKVWLGQKKIKKLIERNKYKIRE